MLDGIRFVCPLGPCAWHLDVPPPSLNDVRPWADQRRIVPRSGTMADWLDAATLAEMDARDQWVGRQLLAHLDTAHPGWSPSDLQLLLDRAIAPPPSRDEALRWAQAHNWAYTTEHDCNGWRELPGQPTRWAVYDADEDDPPVAVCELEDDAIMLVAALRAFAASEMPVGVISDA